MNGLSNKILANPLEAVRSALPFLPQGFGLKSASELLKGTPIEGVFGESVYITIPPLGIMVTTDAGALVIPLLPFLPILPVLAPKVS